MTCYTRNFITLEFYYILYNYVNKGAMYPVRLILVCIGVNGLNLTIILFQGKGNMQNTQPPKFNR